MILPYPEFADSTLKYLTALICGLMIFPLHAETTVVRFAYIGSTDQTAYTGVRQGMDEANLQGRFLGQEYLLDTFDENNIQAINPSQYTAFLVASDVSILMAISKTAADHAVFNLVREDDSLRDSCIANLLHIIPSKRMKADAVRQWQRIHPHEQVQATAWHPQFMKFAARDLNKRYKKGSGQMMDEFAWAGWAAVKMVSDTVSRSPLTGPGDLLHYLKTDLVFDGQKGLEMNFRETGQLRQILLITQDGKLVGEAPVRGAADPEDVDSLGISHCPE